MVKLLSCLLFLFMIPSGYACWAPNCYGAVGFSTETGQTSAFTDYGTEYDAESMLKKDCPSCEYMTFNNGCGTIVYSRLHNFTQTFYGRFERDLEAHAIDECHSKVRKIGLNKTSNDKRRSRVRTNEQQDCKIVVLACTFRSY